MIAHVKETVLGSPRGTDDIFVSLPRYAAAMRVKSKEDKPGLFSVFADSFMEGFQEGLEERGVASKADKKEEKSRNHKPSVALIYAVGAIVESADSGGPPLSGGGNIVAADELAPLIVRAAKDRSVDAIVLRIDSPGGSPTASERILRSVERAQQEGKPVIVSMGGVAASGGYWIAAYADQIFVLPTTITGSIGVVGGKVAFEDLFEKVGVNWEHIRWGDNAGMWSMNTPFSKSESERINAMLDAVYDGFIERVAKGRNMREEDVDRIAGGRVWSGKRAVEIGLADQFGGLNDALDYTATLLGHENREDLQVRVLPKPKTALEHFIELLEGQAVMSQFVGETLQNNTWISDAVGQASVAVGQAQRPQDYMVYQPFMVE